MKNLILLTLISVISCNSDVTRKRANIASQAPPLSELNFEAAYTLIDTDFGTETSIRMERAYRVMKTNGLPNHPTGTFPNPGNPNSIRAQKLSYRFPLVPKMTGQSKWAREPGVALNGVKFEPETAERFVCETGEVYRIEAFQELVDLGLDFNHAHVQPTGAYHYHGVPTELVKKLDRGEDIILVGYAKDGFPIYYSQSGAYKPSYQLAEESRTGEVCVYRTPQTNMKEDFQHTRPDGTFVSDWQYVAGLGDLDECNGIEVNDQYGYFVTEEYPYMSRCLKGEFSERRPKGPPPGSRPPGEHRH